MPKQITDIKQFLAITQRKDATSRNFFNFNSSFLKYNFLKYNFFYNFISGIKVKKMTTGYKFKVRCSRYLYTLAVSDKEKAEKLRQTLPTGKIPLDG